MQTSHATTTEDALLGTLMALSRRMRTRQPGDTLDFAVVPILKSISVLGPMRLSAIAEVLQLDASTVSRHVKQLHERGYLARAIDPDDGRASRIQLSLEGEEALDAHMTRRKALISATLDRWSPGDRDTFRDLLERFNEEVSQA